MQVTVKDLQQRMIEAIRACGAGWHDRYEIAAQFRKHYLNGAEILTLDILAESGKIDKQLQPTNRPHIMKTVYRLK